MIKKKYYRLYFQIEFREQHQFHHPRNGIAVVLVRHLAGSRLDGPSRKSLNGSNSLLIAIL